MSTDAKNKEADFLDGDSAFPNTEQEMMDWLKKDWEPGSKELARPVSQTPAPAKERIKGSDKNDPGSAATKSTGGKIEIGEGAEESIKNKLKEWKDKNPGKKAPSLGALKKVFRRGAGAYSTSFRPTIGGGKPNSRNAWALARVNKFLLMAGGGKVKESYRQADGDLL